MTTIQLFLVAALLGTATSVALAQKPVVYPAKGQSAQ